MRLIATLTTTALIAIAGTADAQLIRERTEGDRRVCTYYGTDLLPNDQVVARELSIGLGEDCPSTAPGFDPNAPVPPNAAFLREGEQSGQRLCIYGQGGRQWSIEVPFTLKCLATPSLLQAAVANTPSQR